MLEKKHSVWLFEGETGRFENGYDQAIKQHSTHSLLGLNCCFHTACWAVDQKQRLDLIKNIQTESRVPCSAIALLSIGLLSIG